MSPSNTYEMVADDNALAAATAELQDRPGPIGLDCEMTLTGLHDCRLALMQVSDGERTWLIDTLAVSPAPLLEVLVERARPLIVHDGSGDLVVIKRLHGVCFDHVFDTMLAARALGIQTPNLANLVRTYLDGRIMAKAQRNSNWARRPLTPAQCSYAALDALVLPELARRLQQEIADRGLDEALAAAIEGLRQRVQSYTVPRRHPLERRFARHTKNPKARRRLKRLLAWRIDMGNRGHIDVVMGLGNQTLMDLARRSPRTIEELRGHGRIPRRLVERYGRAIVGVLSGEEAAPTEPAEGDPS